MNSTAIKPAEEVLAEPSRSRLRWRQRGRVSDLIATSIGMSAAWRRARSFHEALKYLEEMYLLLVVTTGVFIGMIAAKLSSISIGLVVLATIVGLGILLRWRANRGSFERRKLDAIVRPLQILRHEFAPKARLVLAADFGRAGSAKVGAHKLQWMDLQFVLLDGVRARVRAISRVKRKKNKKRRYTKVKESVQDELHIHLKLPRGQMDPSKVAAANAYLASIYGPASIDPRSSVANARPSLPQPIPSMTQGPALVAYVAQQIAWSVELAADEVIIGRGQGCDVVVHDAAFSRRHLSIKRRGTSFWISDLGSGNGTLINEQELYAERHMRPGDVIRVGHYQMRFEGVPAVVPVQSTAFETDSVFGPARDFAPPRPGPGGAPQVVPNAPMIRIEFGIDSVHVVHRTPVAKRAKRSVGWAGEGLEVLVDGHKTIALFVRSYHLMRRSMIRPK